jgi:HK97 family phage portal protein
MANLLDRILQPLRSKPEERNFRVGKYDSATINEELGIAAFQTASSGINERSAMGLSAVYACVNRIASTIGSLDLRILAESEGVRQPAINHPAYNLVTAEPNEYMTAPEFWETITAYAVANGKGFAVIERDARGYATAMHPVPRWEVEEIQTPAGAAYRVQDYGTVFAENMFTLYNLQRKSPIRLHQENLGLAYSAQNFATKYFDNGQATGILTTDQPLRAEQMTALQKSWREQGSAGTKVVTNGFKYMRMSITPDEAQFLQTRKYQTEEIARIFGVPPALIQAESQTTYNNVEQQNLMFGRHTIAPWTRKIEQEINRKLIQARERPNTYASFDLNTMYRGDMAARVKFYEGMVRLGAMSINEVRAKEDMNPTAGGDIHMVQVNQIALSSFDEYSEKISGHNGPEMDDVPAGDDEQRAPGSEPQR